MAGRSWRRCGRYRLCQAAALVRVCRDLTRVLKNFGPADAARRLSWGSRIAGSLQNALIWPACRRPRTPRISTIGRVQLLALDGWGLSVLDPPERRDLLEIFDDRHGRSSTIVTSRRTLA